MRRRGRFGRRLLTVILCLAMVFTSVSAPMNTVTVEAALLGVLLEASGSNIKVTLPGNYATYNIYVDGTKVKENVGPAVYELAQATAGEHTVKVVGMKDGVEDTVDGVFEDVITVTSATTENPSAPAKPVGFVANEVPGQAGMVCFAWAADTSVDHYIAKVDGVVASTAMTNGGTLTGFANGTYTVSLIAANAANEESEAADYALTVVNGVAESEATYKPASGTTTPDGGNDAEDEKDDESIGTSAEYIDLKAKSETENGVWTYVAADASDATFSYDGNSVVVTASTWGQQDWWSVQWTVQDIDVTAGNWQVEYDIVSTISKPVLSKLTGFGAGVDQDTPIIEAKYDLTANETKHYSEVATIGADGKVRLFFNLAGGTGNGTVTISNVKLTAVTGDAGTGEGGEGSGNEGTVTSDYINLEEKSVAENGVWTYVDANNSNATFTYDENSVAVSATGWGQQDWWTVQWTVQDIEVTAGNWQVEYDIISTIDKPVMSKLTNYGVADQDTPIIDEAYNLAANVEKHYSEVATIGADGKVRLFFNLAGGTGEGTVTISNIKLTPVTDDGGAGEGDSGDAEGGEGSGNEGAVTSGYINLEEKSAAENGVWTFVASDASDATFTYDDNAVVVNATSWGQQDWWSVQWTVQDIDVTAGDWQVEYDIVSTISKPVLSKLTAFGAGVNQDTPIVEAKYDLTANETKHYSEVATIGADGKVRLFFNLAGGTGAGTVTISNIKLSPVVEYTYINLEEKSVAENGVWTFVASDASDATFTYDDNAVVVNATSWGQQDWWSVQWTVQDIDVTAGDWQVEYDIVSTIAKPVLSKLTAFGAGVNQDTPIIEAKYDLAANETKHYSEVATIGADGKVRLFFNLAGGTGAGTVTISNIKISPATGEEGGEAETTKTAPALTSDKLNKSNGYKVGGENPVVNFADDADWRSVVTAVKVNNKTIAAEKYTLTEGTLTLDNSIFTKQGVYTIVVEADGYTAASMKLPVYAADLASENWTVKWEDQFNGTELDTTKWSYEIGVRSGDDATSDAPIYWGNNEKQYYTKEAVEVKDGYLVITGDKLTDDVKQQYGITDTTVSYTSGRIRTVTDEGEILAATTYGRIEAKMSLPAGDGYWPAFWMLPTKEATDAYGTWAASGELDIMEAVGQNPTQVNGTIHYGGQWPNNVYSGGTHTFPNGSTIAEEHVYAVEWEPGEIRWYVDDVLYHVENNWYGMDTTGEKFTYPAPYNEDFYVLFNLAMSGNYVSNVMPTEMGKQLKVDYVRILVDENTDYDDSNVTAPSTDRDSEFFEENGGYVDLIVDKDFTTLKDHAFGDGANVVPGTGYWSSAVNTGAGANATVEVVNGAAKYDVTKVGANDYNIQLIQNIPLAKGYTYRITFDAWTDLTTGRGIVVAPKGDADNSWAAYDAGVNAALTTTKKTFTYDFVMKADSDPTARLEMNLGGATGTVYVDNVSVIALTDDQLEDTEESGGNEPLSNGEHVYNGTFDKGTGRLGNWTTEGAVGTTENRDYTVTVGEEGAKLIQEGVQLLEQDDYEISFEAKLTSTTFMRMLLASNTPNVRVTLTDKAGETVYATEEYVLSSEMETYTLGFTVPSGAGTDFGKLSFEFLGEGNTISLDNVSMERLTNAHMEWDAYEFYPIGTESMVGFTTYDEVWTWTTNPISAKNIDGEMVFEVATTPAGENWKVMLQHENVNISKGMTYRIQYAIKASVDNQPVEVKVEDTTYSPCYDANLTVGTEWQYVDTTFTSTLAGAGGLKFCLAGVDQDCTIYVKDVNIVMEGIPTPQFVEGKEVSKMTVGKTAKLEIEHSIKVQSKYDSYTYESSDTSVVGVAADGTMTAKAKGTATITVTSVLGTSFAFDVTVVAAQNAGGSTTGNAGNTDSASDNIGNANTGSNAPASNAPVSNTTTSDTTTSDTTTTTRIEETDSVKEDAAVEEDVVVQEEETVVQEEAEKENSIEEEETPVVSESTNNGINPILVVTIAMALICGLGITVFFVKKRNK